jgi:hypothetical protein
MKLITALLAQAVIYMTLEFKPPTAFLDPESLIVPIVIICISDLLRDLEIRPRHCPTKCCASRNRTQHELANYGKRAKEKNGPMDQKADTLSRACPGAARLARRSNRRGAVRNGLRARIRKTGRGVIRT